MNINPQAAAVLIAFLCPVSANALSPQSLKSALDASDLCSTFKFDAKDIAKYFWQAADKIPADTHIGWDKPAHRVKSATLQDGKLSANFEFSCKPSDEGAIIKLFNMNAENLRFKDDISCTGKVDGGNITDLSCKPTGEIGKLLAATGTVDAKLKPIFKTALPGK